MQRLPSRTSSPKLRKFAAHLSKTSEVSISLPLKQPPLNAKASIPNILPQTSEVCRAPIQNFRSFHQPPAQAAAIKCKGFHPEHPPPNFGSLPRAYPKLPKFPSASRSNVFQQIKSFHPHHAPPNFGSLPRAYPKLPKFHQPPAQAAPVKCKGFHPEHPPPNFGSLPRAYPKLPKFPPASQFDTPR